MGSQIYTNAKKADFESTACRALNFENILNNDSQDPDENFYNAFNFKDSQYFTPEESSRNLNNFDNSSFSMLKTSNIRLDLSVNNANIEAPCLEIINKKSKNILINTQYRQPVGNFNEFETHLNTFLAKSKISDKTCFLVGDLNFNLIDYQSNVKVRNFVNLIFQHSLVPIVNKPTRVTKNNVTLIDYIIINSFIDQENFTGISKTDISDRFPIFIISMKHRLNSSDKKVTIKRRIVNAASIQEFIDILS